MLIGPAFACLLMAPATAEMPVRYDSFKYGRAVFHEVRLNSGDSRVMAKVSLGARPAPISAFGKRTSAVVITGTFFHPSSGYPVGDIVVDGTLRAHGLRGSAIGIGWDGRFKIFDTRFGEHVDWSPYRFAVRGLVRVVSAGVVQPNPKAQHFRDSRIWSRAARVAVGITKEGVVRIFSTASQVTLSELGEAMRSRGVMEAVSLDGGSSAGMIYRGKTLVQPKRAISNVLRVVELGAPVAEPSFTANIAPAGW